MLLDKQIIDLERLFLQQIYYVCTVRPNMEISYGLQKINK